MIDFIDLVNETNVQYIKKARSLLTTNLQYGLPIIKKDYKTATGFILYNQPVRFIIYFNNKTRQFSVMSTTKKNAVSGLNIEIFYDYNPFMAYYIKDELNTAFCYGKKQGLDYVFSYLKRYYPGYERIIPEIFNQFENNYTKLSIPNLRDMAINKITLYREEE